MISVITYHSVGPSSKINTQNFEEHLKYLVHSGFSFHFADEVPKLTESRKRKSKKMVITIDDGYYDAYHFIFPLIKKYNVKITVFLITSRIGTQNSESLPPEEAHRRFINKGDKCGFLNCENILEMQESGLVQFQSHSHHHLLHYSDSSIHSFYNPEFNHHWSLNYASCFLLKAGMPLYTLYPSLVSERYFPSPEFSEALYREAQNIIQSDNSSLKWEDVEKKLHKKALFLNSGKVFSDEFHEPYEDYLKRISDDLIKSRLLLEETLSRKITALSWPWGIYTNKLAIIAEDAGYAVTFSLQRKQRKGVESAYSRIVINKSNIENLEKKLLISQKVFLKRITYHIGSSEKSFWSPQKHRS